jgi:hypothetical protein
MNQKKFRRNSKKMKMLKLRGRIKLKRNMF